MIYLKPTCTNFSNLEINTFSVYLILAIFEIIVVEIGKGSIISKYHFSDKWIFQ